MNEYTGHSSDEVDDYQVAGDEQQSSKSVEISIHKKPSHVMKE